ncbi:GMC family oxidoreductase [Nostoc flagelliforme FACHB-838]|uniref:Cholesterol oxidase n=1 Tax=Nostoc flagelliforme FACHB-838 TaxID=2692904 RepID=A0ABR8DVZ2_9NOSO|nr:GMC oxidoreductase [Nostoc flagelliforme]MBD2533067.1 GMC family oxidoreductase [Nostoc flagelliforme FACHB-838]
MDHKSFSRRHFLQGATLFSASVATSVLTSSRTGATIGDEYSEAVVIGSGYGGAVAALRLGQAGIQTLVLERGRRWEIPSQNNQDVFATYRKPDGRAAWLSSTTLFGDSVDTYTGVLETLREYGATPLCGAGVGGGSLVNNAGVVVPKSRYVFYQVFPRSIDYDQLLDVYFNRVRKILEPSPIPADVLATKYYESTRLFQQHASRAGFANYLIDLAVDWNAVRDEIAGTKVASASIGEIWFGCNSGAKKSLDRNYIPLAEQTKYVEIMPLCVVTAISQLPNEKLYRVSYNRINTSGKILETKTVTCRYLFLAAGSIGTSKLLVKAKATGKLPKLNDHVGKNWGTNGDTVGHRSNLPPIKDQGGFAGAILEHYDNPISPIILMNYPQWNNPIGSQECLGMGIPKANGVFKYDARTESVNLYWPSYLNSNKQHIDATKLTYKILDDANFKDGKQPSTEFVYQNVAHPSGGATIGKACDQYGRVFGYKGLYVVDGALLPGSAGGANPFLTIAGLAERAMDKIIPKIKHGGW